LNAFEVELFALDYFQDVTEGIFVKKNARTYAGWQVVLAKSFFKVKF